MNRDRTDASRVTRLWARSALASAIAAGAVAVVMAALLVAMLRRGDAVTVTEPAELTQLKQELKARPADAALKDRIRQVDAEVRREFLRRQRQLAAGRWVLLGSVLVCVWAGRIAARLSVPLPQPGPRQSGSDYLRQAWRVQDAVLLAIVAAGGLGFMAAWRAGPSPGDERGGGGSGVTRQSARPQVDAATYARQWPRFRGPAGDGVATATNVPLAWDGGAGTGIAWSAEIPLAGHSSPIVWQQHVFITGADRDAREVYALDLASGALKWRTRIEAPGSDPTPPEVMADTGYAAPTPVTDGTHVYAMFANGDLAALDFTGRVVWSQALGPLPNMYGHASSPLVWGDLLIVPLDQGAAEDGKSRLLAVERATGRTVWESGREVPASWTTPIVAGVPGQEQLITAANPWVIAYEPATGRERWRAECLSGDVAPSPVWRDGRAYAVNVGACLAAIRTDGTGTVSETHVAWKAEDGLPDICSPLCTGPRVYLLTSSGLLTCYEAATGTKRWEHDTGGACQASPLLVGGCVVVVQQAGQAVVMDDADAVREIRRNAVGEEGCSATPAVVEGAMLVRSRSRVWCFGAPVGR